MRLKLEGLASSVRDPGGAVCRIGEDRGVAGAGQMLTNRVPLAVRKRGGRKLVVTPGGRINRGASSTDSTLVKALARAFR